MLCLFERQCNYLHIGTNIIIIPYIVMLHIYSNTMEAYLTTWEASAQSQYSGQVFPLPPRPASVETSANKQQNSPASYTIYKYYNNYNTTTRSLYYILVEHTVFVQEYRTPSIGLVSHRRSVFTKWARPTNFPDNNNDLRNESSTKVTYSMRETAWIANTLEDFWVLLQFRTEPPKKHQNDHLR